MKISLQWLSDFLPGPIDAQVAAEALTSGGLPVEAIEHHGEDTVIDVEVTSNRGDCLSHVGVARELSALLNRPFKQIEPTAEEAPTPVTSVTSVAIEAPDLCPHYTARVIRGVRIAPSPQWMQRRLEAVGLRPINNVVDVTNYVMFELGQPLHAFDFDRLQGRRIIVRRARPGETLISIDGHERRLTTDMLVIADAQRAVALAGVMGGRDTEVSDATVNVLLESARFDPLSVRTTSRRLAMKSDSSYRFERGIDPTLPLRASLRAAQLILQTAGGQLLKGVAEAGVEHAPVKKIHLRLSRLNHVLGMQIPSASAMDALARLQLRPELKDDRIEVTVPSWRADLNIEADLIEEVARIIGYDKIPVSDQIRIRLTPPQPQQITTEQIRQTLVAAGYFEAITITFVSDLLADDFKPPEVALPRADAMVRKADARLRPSLLPGLLEAIRRNEAAGTPGVRLFEIGSTFTLDASGRVDERRRVGLAAGADGLREIRGVIEALLGRLDASRAVRVVPADAPGFARGAAGRIEWGGQTVGCLGRIDRRVVDKLDLRSVPVAAELELDPLLAGAQHVPQLRPLPKYPAVRRDLSLVVPEHVRFDVILQLINEVAPANLEEVEYVGVYRGKPLEKGTKSQTISLIFRSPTGTLTSESVDAAVKQVIDAAHARGFKLRE
ncbi:phenylalanine--tRNA ligase subunit beta [Fontivita pretiosa]|uniref:phenylalanine--tRNA ligase subunit beta n=1 Tax=Fontivita pretiosa TaxID=2989684 RepID=UPI003D17DAA6